MIFSKAISRRVVQIPAYNGGVLNRHRPRAAGYLNSGLTYQQMRYSSRFGAMAIILSMDMIYSTMERIVPSRCRLTTRHLGATLFKLRLHQICKSHVTASMHHGTWGANVKSFFDQLIEDPTHPIVMSRPLGATSCSCQKFKVHKPQSIILKDPLLSW